MARWLEIPTPAGPMAVYEASPSDADADAARSAATVVVLMEAFGLSEHIVDICDRLAAAGWRAVAPDLYHRTAPRQVFDAEHLDEALQHYGAVSAETVLADWDALAAADVVSGNAGVAVIGFCMGGHWAFVVACERSSALFASCSFYGAGIERELDRCSRLDVPVRLIYGAEDTLISASSREATEAALAAADVAYRISVYPAGHGFMCAERSSYAPRAAAEAWDELVTFLDCSQQR